MANKKISQLPLSTAADIDVDNDVIAIVDSSGVQTKKATLSVITDAVTSAVSDKHYTHNQLASSTVWNVNHQLNKFPSVTVVDSAGTKVVGEIDFVDSMNCTLTFSAPFSGRAFFN